MSVKIKKIEYLIPPSDIINATLDIFVYLNDNYCTEEGFFYLVEVKTPQFLSTIMEKKNNDFLSSDYPSIIISKLTDNIIKDPIESFINSADKFSWLKLYHTMPKLTTKEINEILSRKKQKKSKLN